MNIVLSILKIAGISVIFLVILLIFLLILLLFVPFRYRFYGKLSEIAPEKERELQCKLTVSFLWFLFRLSWEYERENLKRDIRLFGIPLLRPKKKKQREREETEGQETEQQKAEEQETEKQEAEWQKTEEQEKLPDGETEAENAEETISVFIRIGRFLLRFPEWFLDRLRALKRLISRAAATRNAMLEMVGKALALWRDEHIRGGIKKLWAELKSLLLKLKPRCRKGRVHFGFEDPSLTGKILGILGIFYGFYGDTVRIEPDFERHVLEGELELSGKIRLFLLFRTGFLLYREKEIRYIFKLVKNMGKE